MEQTRIFESVWYRSKPITEPSTADSFIRERGRLIVGPDSLRFEGAQTRLSIHDVEAVEYGVHGSMMNPSVHVRYRDNEVAQSAYFTDGRAGGYAGLFGGTRRLAHGLSHLGPTTFEDAGPRRSRALWITAILLLVLLFVLKVLVSSRD